MSDHPFDYKTWIRQHHDDSIQFEKIRADHYELGNGAGSATIRFYDNDLVEISIARKKDNEIQYYLHFQIKDKEHAQQMYLEMIEALKAMEDEQVVKILLCCSSGFTTSYFAQRLNEAAKQLSLDYEFDATSYFDLYSRAEGYDMILIAPQIGYMLKKFKKALPKKRVCQIPTSLFASYNTGATFSFIQEQLKEHRQQSQEKNSLFSDCRTDCPNHQETVLAIAELYDGNSIQVYIHIYKKGEVLFDDVVIKPNFQKIVLFDLIQYALGQVEGVDLIVLAVPGIIKEGTIIDFPQRGLKNYPMKKRIEERFHIKTTLINNTNAIALGFAYQHPEHEIVTYHSQPYGRAMGGQGTVVHQNLINGISGISGEIKFFLPRMQFSNELARLAKTDFGTQEIVTNALLPTISLIGPDIIVLRAPLINDLEELKKRIATFIPCDAMPEIVMIEDIKPFLFRGIAEYACSFLQETE